LIDSPLQIQIRPRRPRRGATSASYELAKGTGRAGGCRRTLGTLQTDQNRGRTPSERADL